MVNQAAEPHQERGRALTSISTKTKGPNEYLEVLRVSNLRPTFWTSKEYLECLDLDCIKYLNSIWLEEDGLCLFPPISAKLLTYRYDLHGPEKIWAIPCGYGFEMECITTSFLDWEYLYHSTHFRDLSGGKWQVFRKNSRKWPNRNPGWEYKPLPSHEFGQFFGVLESWLYGKSPEEEIHDSDVIFHYLERSSGNLAGIWKNDELVGVNAWDTNHWWVNFRYCFTKPGEPFLSEFLRLQFYLSQSGIICDGGTLGNSNLEAFKDKLNPYHKGRIYSKEA